MKNWRIYEFESISALYTYFEVAVSYLTPGKVWSIFGFHNGSKDNLWVNVVKSWNNFQKFPVKKFISNEEHICTPHISLDPKKDSIEYLIGGVSFYSTKSYEDLIFDMRYEEELKSKFFVDDSQKYNISLYDTEQDIDGEKLILYELEDALKKLTA